VSYHHKKSY